MTDLITLAPLAVLPVLAIVAGIKDLTSYTIPNWISGALILAFFPAAFAAHLPLSQLAFCAAIGGVGLVMGMGMFALGWIGGGDAKLFAASALWLGWPAAVLFLGWTGAAGGALAVALLQARRHARGFFDVGKAPGWAARLLTPGENVPYGVAIAFGALVAFPHSALVAGKAAGGLAGLF